MVPLLPPSPVFSRPSSKRTPATTGTQPARMRVRARTLPLSLLFTHTFSFFVVCS